jgi:hypothetical protein
MVKKYFGVLCCTILCSFSSHINAQGLSAEGRKQMAKVEDSLVVLADSMYNAFIPDTRPEYCEKFVRQLVRSLKTPNSYEFNFDKLKSKINIISSDDNAFRIFNWLVIPAENTCRYYGAIQVPSEKLKLYPLIDYTKELNKGAEDSVLTNSKWYGALYYKILTNEVKGEKVYTLFGLNSSSPISNKKLLDPLTITQSGVTFGAPIFNLTSHNLPGKKVKRYIMEYKKEVAASLNWDEEQKMVYFDKLVSQVNDPNRKYTYVPSGQYDGFRWFEGQWNYISDLVPVQTFKDGEAPAPKPVKGKE